MKKLSKIVIVVLAITTSLFWVTPTYAAGIARDTNATGLVTGSAASSLTYAQNITSANEILFLCFSYNSGNTLTTAPTYNGTNMTEIAETTNGTSIKNDLWYITNPSTGSHNVVVHYSALGNIVAYSESYTGANMTGQPDSFSTSTPTTEASFTQSTTVVANNSWIVWCGNGDSGNALTAGANTSILQQDDVHMGVFQADTNATQTSGSKSMNVTATSQNFYGTMASFSPVSTASNAIFFAGD